MVDPKTRGTILCVLLALAATSASCTRFDPGPQPAAIGAARAAARDRHGAAPTTAAAPTTTPAAKGPLKLTVQEAILLALENNRQLAVERLDPAIRRTFEQQERAVFDPVIGGEISTARTQSHRLSRAGAGTEGSILDSAAARASVGALLPTGTAVEVGASAQTQDSSLYSDVFNATRVGFSVTQALLRGAGLRVNLARLRQARLDTRASEYELRALAEAVVAEVESSYWDYALAQRQIRIYSDSVRLAEKQLAEIGERIKVGSLAETELAAAQAEVALRTEGLINVRSDLARIRLRLLRLMSPPGEGLWSRAIDLRDLPAAPAAKLDDVEQHVQVALRMRPDLNQARLGAQRQDLEIVRTRNGLLPRMDLFITFGKTGYAESFGRSVQNIRGDGYDTLVGLRLEYPFANRDSRARHHRAVLGQRQVDMAIENLAQLVEEDVRSASIEVERTRQQIPATAATRRLQEEKLRVETEKFRVGKSTSLLVAQAQRDLLTSQIGEIQALVNCLQAMVALYRLEGSLLERRGIAAPGRQPVRSGGRAEKALLQPAGQ
jgi:outer membrane protein